MHIDGNHPAKKANFRPNRDVRSNGGENHVQSHDRVDQSHIHSNHEVHNNHGQHDNRANNHRRPDDRQFTQGNARASSALASAGGFQARMGADNLHNPNGTWNLTALARKTVKEFGLRTEFPQAVRDQMATIKAPATVAPEKLLTLGDWDKLSAADKDAAKAEGKVVDLRSLPSSSIDNGDADKIVTSKDLDQLEASQRLPDGSIRMWVEIADVATVVAKGTAIDKAAIGDVKEVVAWFKKFQADPKAKPPQGNSFSLYTPGEVYPMLPEELSTDLTSLNADKDRTSMIAEYTIGPDGKVRDESVYKGLVHSQAAMAYPGIGAWLDPNADGVITEERGKVPGYLADAPPEIPGQVEMQAEASQKMKKNREENGALRFADMETQAKMNPDGTIADIEVHHATVSTQLIENLMVSANGVVSRYLEQKGFPTLQRVVKSPEKWDKIVELSNEIAQKNGFKAELPETPDAKALQKFLNDCKDLPDFAEISSGVVRLVGRGEYMAVAPGETPAGHFALAVDDYSHFTAPNRRGPDLVLHRMLQAAMAGEQCPYSQEELTALAAFFTAQEGAIKKAERQIEKIGNAIWLEQNNMLNQTFEGTCSGANAKGAWVRATVPDPDPNKAPKHIEGFLQNAGQVAQGDKVKCELTALNVEKGRIDFTRQQ